MNIYFLGIGTCQLKFNESVKNHINDTHFEHALDKWHIRSTWSQLDSSQASIVLSEVHISTQIVQFNLLYWNCSNRTDKIDMFTQTSVDFHLKNAFFALNEKNAPNFVTLISNSILQQANIIFQCNVMWLQQQQRNTIQIAIQIQNTRFKCQNFRKTNKYLCNKINKT